MAAIDLVVKVQDKTKLVFANKVERLLSLEIQEQNRMLSDDFVRWITTYPPEGPGNRPPSPYWKRGTGMILANGQVNPPSQNYRDSWVTKEVRSPFGGKTTITTPVTYAPYLIDNIKQTAFHKANGWETIEQTANALGIKIDRQSESLYSVVDMGTYYEGILRKAEQIFRY